MSCVFKDGEFFMSIVMSDIRKILFVCLGNICRSPSAEAVMKKMAADRGVELFIDSAGTIAAHAGESADARMQTHAVKRGYDLTSISRQVVAEDFEDFDMIIGMDASNLSDLADRASSPSELGKISNMTDYCTRFDYKSVPDPYYGGSAGFELVLDLLEDACDGLLKKIS